MKDSKKYHFTRSFIEKTRKDFYITHKQFIKASNLKGDELDFEFTGWFGERWKLEGEAGRDLIVSKVGHPGYYYANWRECEAFIEAEKNKYKEVEDNTETPEC
jgi:hypothetical protein